MGALSHPSAPAPASGELARLDPAARDRVASAEARAPAGRKVAAYLAERAERSKLGHGPERGAAGRTPRRRRSSPRSVFPADGDPPINVSRAFLLSGAQALLTSWRVPLAGASVLP